MNNRDFLLRPYQRDAVEAIIAGFGEYRSQLLVHPTGGGKTIVFTTVANHYQPGRTLIVAHREELLTQAHDKAQLLTGLEVAVEKAESRASLDAPIVVASIQTLSRRQSFPRDHFRLVVIDEAHHARADSYRRAIDYFDAAFLLGVTATPDRGDKRSLADIFENVAHQTTLVDLIRDGYLSRIRVKTLPVRVDMRGARVLAGDFDENDSGRAIERHLSKIADILARDFQPQDPRLSAALQCPEHFAVLCRERGLRAEHVDGESRDRHEILARFHSGETMLASNAMRWTEGFDEPSVILSCPCGQRRFAPFWRSKSYEAPVCTLERIICWSSICFR